ncbi:unnamed protein product [Knipowitschia caucasica]
MRLTVVSMHKSIIGGENFPVERCTTCCTFFHCPICPMVKPQKLHKMRIHLKSHLRQAISYKDWKICRCHMLCRDSAHYHCPSCNTTLIRKTDMERHLCICDGPLLTVPVQSSAPTVPPL